MKYLTKGNIVLFIYIILAIIGLSLIFAGGSKATWIAGVSIMTFTFISPIVGIVIYGAIERYY